MKQKRQLFNLYGLKARLGFWLVGSAFICIFLFFISNICLNGIFSNYYENPDFRRSYFQSQCRDLQDFVDENQISVNNMNLIKKWEKEQPIILLEIYKEEHCIYSSIHDVPISSMIFNELENEHMMVLSLADCQVDVFLYSDLMYQFGTVATAISFLLAVTLFIMLFFYNIKKLIQYICQLNNEIQILEGGNLEYNVTEKGNDEITDLARSMNRMRATLQEQMETEQQLYRANKKLITQMSHDLRTPLTGIMLYLEILRSKRYDSEEKLQDYLEKIDAKAHYMKLLSDHLFEYSIKDDVEKQLEPQSMETALGQALKGIHEDLIAREFQVESEYEWRNCFVQVNQEYIHRICENIVSNIEKYAKEGECIRIDTVYYPEYCGFSVMNIFDSEHSEMESHGVGVESIRHMMKQMNGICNIEQTDVTFEITILFPVR